MNLFRKRFGMSFGENDEEKKKEAGKAGEAVAAAVEAGASAKAEERAPAAAGAESAEGAGGGEPGGKSELEAKIVEALKTIYDPEIPVNIYELGLIYTIELDEENNAAVKMTLTAPNCPAAGMLPGEVHRKVAGVDGVNEADVQVVWDPPWSPDFMSKAAKLQLGML